MTDEELIKALRMRSESDLCREAADRIEALRGALAEIESISVHSGGEVLGVTADHWRMAFEQAQDVARAALKGADHE